MTSEAQQEVAASQLLVREREAEIQRQRKEIHALKQELDENRKRMEQAEEFAASVAETLHEEVSKAEEVAEVKEKELQGALERIEEAEAKIKYVDSEAEAKQEVEAAEGEGEGEGGDASEGERGSDTGETRQMKGKLEPEGEQVQTQPPEVTKAEQPEVDVAVNEKMTAKMAQTVKEALVAGQGKDGDDEGDDIAAMWLERGIAAARAMTPPSLSEWQARSEALFQQAIARRERYVVDVGGRDEVIAWDVWRETYVWDYFTPDYICPDAERVGRLGDGGKWICGVDTIGVGDERGGEGGEGGNGGGESGGESGKKSGRGRDAGDCLVYAYGVRQDVSFERELHKRTGCRVHAFDPTVGGLPDVNASIFNGGGGAYGALGFGRGDSESDSESEGEDSGIAPMTPAVREMGEEEEDEMVFHKQAIGAASEPSKMFLNVETLHDTMARLGHDHVDVLKVDIEGDEWTVFDQILAMPGPLPFDQLLIELHFQDVPKVRLRPSPPTTNRRTIPPASP